jgi:hypothetical protein
LTDFRQTQARGATTMTRHGQATRASRPVARSCSNVRARKHCAEEKVKEQEGRPHPHPAISATTPPLSSPAASCPHASPSLPQPPLRWKRCLRAPMRPHHGVLWRPRPADAFHRRLPRAEREAASLAHASTRRGGDDAGDPAQQALAALLHRQHRSIAQRWSPRPRPRPRWRRSG